MSKFCRVFIVFFAALFALLSVPARADAALDVSAVTTYLGTDVTTAVTGVGAAVLLLAVTVVGFRWIKKMF